MVEPYWEDDGLEIYCGDCLEVIPELPPVDLVIADPPYNLSVNNGALRTSDFGGFWKQTNEDWDKMAKEDYFEFSHSWLSLVKHLMKPTSSIWTFGTYHNIGIINVLYQKLDIEILNEIIWFKRNAFPHLAGRRFTASHENLLWGHTGNRNSRKYFFNYEKMKELDFPNDNLNSKDRQVRTVWDIPNNKKKNQISKHPTQKPLSIIKRIILATSKENDTIFDPFMGSGTTLKACQELGREAVGIEIEERYCNIAVNRLREQVLI